MILHFKTERSLGRDCPDSPAFFRTPNQRLCDELNDTTGLLDLLLSITAEVAGAHNEGNLGETALAENLGVAEGEEVDDGGGVGLLAAQVGVTLLGGDEGPKLYRSKDWMLVTRFVLKTIQPMLKRRTNVALPMRFCHTAH